MSFWVAGAIGGSALLGYLGSQSAADTQAAGQRQAAQTQQHMFDTINAQEQPFIQAGYGATSTLAQLLGIAPPGGGTSGGAAPPTQAQFTKTTGGTPSTPMMFGEHGERTGGPGTPGTSTFDQAGYDKAMAAWNASQASATGGGTVGSTGLPPGYLTQQFKPTQEQLDNYPGYQFALKTGGQAVRNADTPGVGSLSGPALKDLMNFNVGTANQFYGQYFNQFQQQQQNIFSRLSGIAGLGQNAASNVGTSGTSLGTGVAQAQAAAAGSQAGGIVGATNALGGSAVPLGYLMSGQNTGNGTLPNSQAQPQNSSSSTVLFGPGS